MCSVFGSWRYAGFVELAELVLDFAELEGGEATAWIDPQRLFEVAPGEQMSVKQIAPVEAVAGVPIDCEFERLDRFFLPPGFEMALGSWNRASGPAPVQQVGLDSRPARDISPAV